MAERRSPIVDVADPAGHPAATAWCRLLGSRTAPTGVQILKSVEKTQAYRLVGCAPDGGNVVATHRLASATAVERAVYESVLSRSSVLSLRLHGVIEEADGMSWTFTEDAGEATPDLRRYEDRVLAGRWLGRLHVDIADVPRPDGLPDRSAAATLDTLASTLVDLASARADPQLGGAGRQLIDDIVRRLEIIAAAWGRVTDGLDDLPWTVVHGDLVAKNMRYRGAADDLSLVIFDWDMAGWGPPVRDLALVDLGAYLETARPLWDGRIDGLGRSADIGRLFGLIEAMGWEMPRLRLGGHRRALLRLASHHERLGTAAVLAGLGPRPTASVLQTAGPGRSPDVPESGTGLRAMEPHSPARIVEVIDRAPNTYRSTSPSEIVRCLFDDGIERRVFVKHDVAGAHAGGPFWAGGPYEARIYRDVLSACDLATPAYLGSWSDLSSGETSLAIEYVEGWRLSRSDPAWLVEAARWLGRLHREATPVAVRDPRVRVYDGVYLRDCARAAVEAERAKGDEAIWLEPVVAAYDAVMVPRLQAAEPTFIHGEPYPQNIIVSGGRIRTVDWQSAAIGPGAIDLACLTQGRWPTPLVAESEAAYVQERWSGRAPATFAGELEGARMYWSLRWLGVAMDATTAGQREGYLRVLQRSAKQLGAVMTAG